MKLIILAVSALITSIISGILGMAGGIMLLAVMLCFLPHADAIAAHGAVQLVSNGTRTLCFLRSVDWKAIRAFVAGAIPGSAIAALLLLWIRSGQLDATEPYLKLLIGCYVLGFSLRGSPTKKEDVDVSPVRYVNFFAFGLLAGALGLTIGAVGPLIAPLFLKLGYTKERLVGTKAICQASIHALKIPALLLTDLARDPSIWLVVGLMVMMVIPGTIAGKRILKHVEESLFVKLYRAALFLAGIKIFFYDGLYGLM